MEADGSTLVLHGREQVWKGGYEAGVRKKELRTSTQRGSRSGAVEMGPEVAEDGVFIARTLRPVPYKQLVYINL